MQILYFRSHILREYSNQFVASFYPSSFFSIGMRHTWTPKLSYIYVKSPTRVASNWPGSLYFHQINDKVRVDRVVNISLTMNLIMLIISEVEDEIRRRGWEIFYMIRESDIWRKDSISIKVIVGRKIRPSGTWLWDQTLYKTQIYGPFSHLCVIDWSLFSFLGRWPLTTKTCLFISNKQLSISLLQVNGHGDSIISLHQVTN